MGRIVTKPLGYQVNNSANVGTLSLISGSSYEVTNVNTQDIATALYQIGANFLSKSLCTSASINQWAAFKPNALGSIHGMSINGSDEIVYSPPTDSTGYKLGQFGGYNKNAPLPGVMHNNLPSFKTTGKKTGQLLLRLPEFSVKDINSQISHIRLSTFRKVSGSWVLDTVMNYQELTDEVLQYLVFSQQFEVNIQSLEDVECRVVIELGRVSSNVFYRICYFPRQYSYTWNMLYKPDPILEFSPIDKSQITPAPSYYDVFDLTISNESLVVSLTVSFSFDFCLQKFTPEGYVNVSGTADVYMRNPTTEVWHLVKSNQSLPNSGTTSVSGTLNSSNFPPNEITSNIQVEYRNIALN